MAHSGDRTISTHNPKLSPAGASWMLGGIAFIGVFVASQLSSWLSNATPQTGLDLVEAALAAMVTLAASRWIFAHTSPSSRPGEGTAAAGNAWRREQDPLTHTFSQHGITVKLIEFLSLAERYDRNLSVVLIEIEHLMDLAAQKGRSVVDHVLVQMADALIEHIRTTDRVGRLDDDRFLLVLPETDLAGARIVEDRIREFAHRIEVDTEPRRKAHITVVTGVASFRRGEDINHLLARAEQALSEAKGTHGASSAIAA